MTGRRVRKAAFHAGLSVSLRSRLNQTMLGVEGMAEGLWRWL